MRNNNLAIYGPKIIFEILQEIIYFPLWWYSRGFLQMLISVRDFLLNREKSLGLSVWIVNIFKPMYGQRDMAGILISFFMRLFQIIVRSFAMLFWIVIGILLILTWVVVPPLVVYQLIFQIIPF